MVYMFSSWYLVCAACIPYGTSYLQTKPLFGMGPVRIGLHHRHTTLRMPTSLLMLVDRAGWQAKMASIEFWMP